MTGTSGSVFDEAFWRDPYPAYASAREDSPVCEVPLPDGGTTWLITRYDDVRAASTDPRLSKDISKLGLPDRAPSPDTAAMMLLTDPPDHTRLRRFVSRAFTPRRTADLRPRVEQITSSLLDGLTPDAPVDLVGAFAEPLTTQVICELLGVPDEDRDRFGGWSNTLMDVHPDEAKQAAGAALGGYLAELVEAKRQVPDGALLSALVQVSETDDRLSAAEVVAMGMLLLIAGLETTANLIGNAALGVVRDRALRERLTAHPEDTAAVVEEFLRWDGPVHGASFRFATEDVEYAGVVVPAGATVQLALGAANRDPARFARPEVFDPERAPQDHLAFGHGPHFCLGAPLARLEGEVALRSLLARFPDLVLATGDAQLEYRRSTSVHGLRALPVLLRPGHADGAGD